MARAPGGQEQLTEARATHRGVSAAKHLIWVNASLRRSCEASRTMKRCANGSVMRDDMQRARPRPPVAEKEILARYASRAAPRYTSYPTAPHFHAGVGEDECRGWLAALDPAKPVSLYLHVPFCRRLCWYCGCNMKLASRYEPVARYVETLLQEVDLLAEALPARMSVSHLHWGGGTPTTLRPDDLARVMERVADRFDDAPGAERAIEADPRALSDEMIRRIGELGFTRASFGVQEFDPAVQKAINRIQPPELVEHCVAGLRAAGVAAINFDLIYGLPLQTAEALEKTARRCLAMAPDRIALFGYAHVPWMAKKQRLIAEADLPGMESRLEQARRAAAVFEAAGYQSIGVDHFALPGDPLAQAARVGELRRNFQGYTTDDAEALLGLGATSIGRTPQGYAQNLTETGAWARAVEAGRLPVARGVALGSEDRLRGWVIERLMCDAEVNLSAAGDRFGAPADWWRRERAALAALEADGLLVLSGSVIGLTPFGLPLRRIVAAAFDQYLAEGAGRHSKAV